MRQHGNFETDGRNSGSECSQGMYIRDHPKMAEFHPARSICSKLYEAEHFQKTPDIAHYLLQRILGSVGVSLTALTEYPYRRGRG